MISPNEKPAGGATSRAGFDTAATRRHDKKQSTMPASIMRGLLREAIESYLPSQALAVAQVAEKSEHEHLLRMAEMLEARP